MLLDIVAFSLLFSKLSRYFEEEADHIAARNRDTTEGGIKVMEQFHAFAKEWEADMPQWSFNVFCRKLRRLLRKPFESHPRPKERIKYLEEIKEQFAH